MKINKVAAAIFAAYGHMRQRELTYSLNAYVCSGGRNALLKRYA